MKRTIGLAHLSALHLSPPQLVDAAADAGFTSVGVRVFPATTGESTYPMAAGSVMSARTLDRLAARGVAVRDVEVFTLNGNRGRAEWEPVLEAGAALGASVLNVIGSDPEVPRLTDTLAALVGDAREYGIRPSVEPISYQPLSSVAAAAQLVKETGCGIMLDILHFVRAGGRLTELEELPAGAVTVIQLCDGPADTPDLPVPHAMPLGQDVNGSPRQIESRSKRLPPGEGVFPLREILALFPDTPVSVEVPDVRAVEVQGIDSHLRGLHQAAASLIHSS
ncbi:sugar phosphate isomerase/epimerase [Paenarthrobacter nicotinovorans]|uniref:sugar phosphate isomerase/epimerase family protein n=1 Tax=Micrococcaceae TaxID=1268 RepID=UPI0008763AE4|nr:MULTISPECIES: sugar phosphate isomerase/epimerase [Micrococcaceae]MDR6436726.1 sugar phosphate isomerase/epimerase [Paenarthrobacter nicotinovorans]SCZ56788.1 Sugar phosphate isomerase/epimerase [Arthrobacter sp. UNCCL28]